MIAYPTSLAMRQRPQAGARMAKSISGGFWLPGVHGGGVSDASGCNAPAKIVGGVTLTDGPFGSPALRFDGSTGYVDCGLNGNTAFNWSTGNPIPRTFWAWVRAVSGSNLGPIFSKGDNVTNTGWNAFLTAAQNLQSGMVCSSSNGLMQVSASLILGAWHMIAICWSGEVDNTLSADVDGKFMFYVDGVAQPGSSVRGTGSGSQNNTDSFNLRIGGAAQYTGGTAGPSVAYSNLDIDHWALDHRFYSAREVADLYARPFKHFAPPATISRLAAAPTGSSRLMMVGCGI